MDTKRGVNVSIKVGTKWSWVVVMVVELDDAKERVRQLCCYCIAMAKCYVVVLTSWTIWWLVHGGS